MSDELVTGLLPVLSRSLEPAFNVFDVMHHGMHEKQLSNVFAWLLDAGGTHALGDRFLTEFIAMVNVARPASPQVPGTGYTVRQEVDVALPGEGADIADIVLDSATARIVIENYESSDGHGRGFDRYEAYGQHEDRIGVVVMLCRDEDRGRLQDGWERSCVVTYAEAIGRLSDVVAQDHRYRREHPEATWFIAQLHGKFVEGGGRVEDGDVLEFVDAMCRTGEAHRYGARPHNAVAERFASEMAVQARQRFIEGRDLLRRLKRLLRSACDGSVSRQLESSFGVGSVRRVSANLAGMHEWTVGFDLVMPGDGSGAEGEREPLEVSVQLVFGPTAWHYREHDPGWSAGVDVGEDGYSRVFVSNYARRTIRTTRVTLEEVLDGLDPDDLRLHDAIVAMVELIGAR